MKKYGSASTKENSSARVTAESTYNGTVRLQMDFKKLAPIQSISYAYNVLVRKQSSRTKYMVTAIQHYKLYGDMTFEEIEEKNTLEYFRCLRFLKNKYSLSKKKDVQDLFDSCDLEALEDSVPKDIPAKKMLCGFTSDDDEAVSVFNELYNMVVTNRIAYVSNAIRVYIDDGFDFEETEIEATRLLTERIRQYRETGDMSFIKNFSAVINVCDKIENSGETGVVAGEIETNLPGDIADLFVSQQEVQQFLK